MAGWFEQDAMEQAARLASADVGTEAFVAELDEALAEIGLFPYGAAPDTAEGSERARALVASLAGIASYAIGQAGELGPVVLRDAIETLRATQRESLSRVLGADVWERDPHAAHVERRSERDRRAGAERRQHTDDSPPARVNRWLYGERRVACERRSGVERRQALPLS
jgi:hypothetical protein